MNIIRKKKSILVVLILLLLSVMLPSQVFAASYKDLPKKIGIAADKVWNIKFNEDINKDTINSSNIAVLDSNNKGIPIKVTYIDSRTVSVAPVSKYEEGQTYSLVVKDTIKGKSGGNIKAPARMEFTIENKVVKPNSPKGYIVALDAGRAGNDIGSEIGQAGVKGKDVNLQVALKAGKILEQNGVSVVYTRTGDNVSWSKDDSVAARSKIVNDAKANLLISIHCNSYSSSTAVGTETYYLSGNQESKKLASYIQNQLPTKTGLYNRGIVESSLKTLSSVNATGVYVALGFLTNPKEEQILGSEEYKNNSAEAIANAVLNYLDIKMQTYIKDIQDISVILYKGEKYTLPTTVTAVMSDNTDSKVSVKWDKTSVDTSKEGTFYYKGTVARYSESVNLKVKVISDGSFNESSIGKVFIDPAGASNTIDLTDPAAVKSKDINLAIGLKVGKILEDKGINVAYSRKTDSVSWSKDKDIDERVKLANASGAELLVRIQMNSYTSQATKGIETYYKTGDDIGKAFAENVQSNLITYTSGVSRGVKTKVFNILDAFNGTGIVVYPGFITNPDEEALLKSSEYQDKIAKAIATSILEGYNSSNETIKDVKDISVKVTQGEKYSLPTKVSALTNEGKTVQKDVIWETDSVDTSKAGTITIKGRVKNYDKLITLSLIVSSKNATNYKVAIDAGHGGYDSGAVGPNGTKEKDVTLAVSLKVGDILVKNGVNVVFTRTSDNVPWPNNKNEELQMRCDIANEANVDYFVSIHVNSIDGSPTTSGTETYYDRDSTKGIPLATNIQLELVSELNSKDRGIKGSGLYVVKYTDAPAVLVELDFISNPDKEKLMNNSDYQQKYAEAIARGILKTLGQ